MSVATHLVLEIGISNMALRICLLLAFVSFSIGEDDLVPQCVVNDFDCIKRQPLHILSKTYAGYPSLGIEPIDPLIVPSTDVDLDNEAGMVLHFKNINITGFKNSKPEYNSYNIVTKQQTQKMEAEITISSDVELVLTESGKTFTGTYYAESTVYGKSIYLSGTKKINGRRYYVIGPETTTCEVIGESTVILGSELQRALDHDEDALELKPKWEVNTPLHNKILCGLAENGFSAFLKTLKAIVKAYDVRKFVRETYNYRIRFAEYPNTLF